MLRHAEQSLPQTFLQFCKSTVLMRTPETQHLTLFHFDGGENPQNGTAGAEAVSQLWLELTPSLPKVLLTPQSLDIEYTVGLATGVPVNFITVEGDVNTGDQFANVLIDTASYLLDQTAPPQVVTTRYGLDEDLISDNLAQ